MPGALGAVGITPSAALSGETWALGAGRGKHLCLPGWVKEAGPWVIGKCSPLSEWLRAVRSEVSIS